MVNRLSIIIVFCGLSFIWIGWVFLLYLVEVLYKLCFWVVNFCCVIWNILGCVSFRLFWFMLSLFVGVVYWFRVLCLLYCFRLNVLLVCCLLSKLMFFMLNLLLILLKNCLCRLRSFCLCSLSGWWLRCWW